MGARKYSPRQLIASSNLPSACESLPQCISIKAMVLPSPAKEIGVAIRAWLRGPIVTTSCTSASSASRSEEHTSELQSLMRISYAVFCLKKKKKKCKTTHTITHTLKEQVDY